MARPIEFDREEAIAKAMALFLQKGYEATSIEDLTRALGISRASLYNSFGDKRALMLESLGCAERLSAEMRKGALGSPGGAREVLEKFFRDLQSANRARRHSPGCIFLTIGAELGSSDPEVRFRVEKTLEASRMLFREILERERKWKPAEIEKKSAALLGLLVSVLMLTRVHPDPQLVDAVIGQGLAVLD